MIPLPSCRKPLLLLLVTLSLLFVPYSIAERARAIEFTLTDINGKQFSLNQFQGKVVVIDFFATWCGPCREAIPHLAELGRKFSSTQLTIISISVDPRYDSDELLRKYAAENSMSWVVARDTAQIGTKYGVKLIPTIVIIDGEGYVQNTHVGITASSTLISEVESLLRGMTPTEPARPLWYHEYWYALVIGVAVIVAIGLTAYGKRAK